MKGFRFLRSCFPFLTLLLLGSLPAYSAQVGVIEGHVAAADGAVAAGARVLLSELNRRTTADADGSFRFTEVPFGEYLLEARSPRYGAITQQVVVATDQPVQIRLVLDLRLHEEVVVTAGPDQREASELAQPVDSLSGSELIERLQPTLGETLAETPGVSSTYFGPGASRPIIRGLGGDRIRVLENGLGVGDASSTSPDHAVSTDPSSAEKIEVLRGPATLLYGSSAIGGVVNVLDQRIPSSVPEKVVEGSLNLQGGTVSNERGGALSVQGRLGRNWVAHVDGSMRATGDYEIPGHAAVEEEEHEGEEEEEHAEGKLENSSLEMQGLTLGLSYVGQRGFLGISATGFDTEYGIPGGAHHHEEEEGLEGEEEHEEESVRIDLKQRRLDLQGQLDQSWAAFRGAKFRFGMTNYEHTELEGEEIGTVFQNDSWEGRLELPHAKLGPLQGSVGVQFSSRKFEAIGEEAFVPPSDTDSFGVFVFEELGSEPLRLQFGARFENQQTSAEDQEDRSFQGLSGSVGLVWQPSEAYSAAVSVARAVKLPNAEELYSNGPHIATNAFELGDPDLDEETSLGVDLALRKRTGRLTAELTFFLNDFDGFIFEQRTEEEFEELSVYRYVQRDARFLGGEFHADLELFHTEPHHLGLEFLADIVRAELTDSGDPLPRIVPPRLGLGLIYQGSPWSARVEARRVFEQDRLADFETETPAYTMWNASLGYRFFTGGMIHDVLLKGTNLTNEEARNHASFLKDLAPMPGRNVGLAYSILF